MARSVSSSRHSLTASGAVLSDQDRVAGFHAAVRVDEGGLGFGETMVDEKTAITHFPQRLSPGQMGQ